MMTCDLSNKSHSQRFLKLPIQCNIEINRSAEGTEPSAIEDTQDPINESPKERITARPLPRKDKTNEKGRGNQQESERSRQVSPALMRGPKPTKLKPPVIKETQEATTEESVTEPSQETTEGDNLQE